MSNSLDINAITFTYREARLMFGAIKYEIDDCVNLPFTESRQERLNELFPLFWELFTVLYSDQLKALDKCPSSHSTK